MQDSLLLHTAPHHFDCTNIANSPVLMTTLICIYLFVREEVSHYFLVKSIRKVLKRYTSFWNLVRITAIISILVTNVFISTVGQATPNWLIFMSKTLSWLILIGFIKGTNLKLSLFIGKWIDSALYSRKSID